MKDVQIILEKIKKSYMSVLGDNLTGIYVHGSIAFGCFNWEKSDIDFIVVLNHAIDSDVKLALLRVLVALLPQAPPKGFEMSVVLKENCEKFVYPTPYELHFSQDWLERYRTDPYILCNNNLKTDPDLAAHFTVIRQVGLVLCGQPVEQVFGEVEKAFYIDSIRKDIADAKSEFLNNPVYFTLNLCRVLAYLQDGLILSKQQGGVWGAENLDPRFRPLIQRALSCYATAEEMTIEKPESETFFNCVMSKIERCDVEQEQPTLMV